MEQTPFIELPTRLGSEFINPSDVIAIQANDKEVILTLENKVYKEVRLPFSKAVTLFDEPHFFTCHRSHLINILKTKQYYKKEGKIILAGDIKVPLSDTYKKAFVQVLGNYCKKC